MDETLLFLGEADFSAAMDELAMLDDALGSSDELIGQLGGNADMLAGLDEAISALVEAAQAMQEMFVSATDSLDGLATTAQDATMALDEMSTASASIQELAMSAEEATVALDDMGAAGGTAGAETEGAFGGAGGAMGATMLAGAVVMAGKSFLSMGSSAEDSFAQVEGMAGVTKQQLDAMMPALQQQSIDLHTSLTNVGNALYFVESAGYSGKDALNVEHEALEAASASGANFQDVASALTGELHSYNASAADAKMYTDQMVEAVVQGKQSFQDFSSAIGPLAAVGHQTGVSFAEVTAAEATMTQINPHVRQDANELQHLMQAVGMNVDKVAESAGKMGLSFDENSYKSMNLMQRLQYLQDITKGNQTDFAKLVGGTSGLSAAMDLLSGSGSTYAGILDKIKHSSGATDAAFQTTSDTMSANAGKVGAALSVLSYNLTTMIAPYVSEALAGLSGALSGFSSWMETHGQIAIPILIGLATALGTILVGAAVAIVGPMLLAVAPFAAIGLAVGAAVAGIILLVANWQKIVGAIMGSPLGPVLRDLGAAFRGVGEFIASLFIPVWQQLQQMWTADIMPALNQLMPALKQMMPLFEAIGALVGGSLLITLGLLVGVVSGLAKGISYMIEGLGTAFTGIVMIIQGVAQVVGGIVQFIVDLFSGHFEKLVPDLKQIGVGILMIFVGLGTAIMGVLQAAWGLISGFFGGFVQGIIAFFTHLFDAIVGHSLIPDLVRGIITWIGRLPGEVGALIVSLATGMYDRFETMKNDAIKHIEDLVTNTLMTIGQWEDSWIQKAEDLKDRFMGALNTMWSQVTSFFTGLPGQALTWGEDMLNGFIQGIKNGVGGIGAALGGVGDKIKSLFGFSVPEEGPLSDADKWMPDMIMLFAEGITANQDKLKAAMHGMGSTMQVALQTTAPQPGMYTALAPQSLPALPHAGLPGGIGTGTLDNGAVVSLLVQILAALVAQNGSASTSIAMTNNIHTPATDAQQLYALFQSLGGFQYGQSLQRGAAGLG